MEKMEIQKLARGASITFVGGAAGAGFTYLTGVVISRMVGSEVVGIYYLSLVWVYLVSALSRFGFADALLRFIPPERRKGRQEQCARIVKTTVGLGGLLAVVLGSFLFLFVGPIGRYVGWDPLLVSYLSWFFAVLPLHVLFTLFIMVVQSHQLVTQVVLVRDLLQPAMLFTFTVSFLKLGFGDQVGLIGGFALSQVVGILVICRWVVKTTPNALRVTGWMALGPLFIFSVPAVGADVSHFLFRWIDTLLVGQFLALRDVGIYSAAIRTSLFLYLIPMAINAIYATMASGYYHTDELQKLEKALQLSLRWSLILALPVVLLFALASREFMLLWGGDFVQGATTLVILAVAQLFGIPGGILAYTLVMCNRQTLELVDTLVTLALIALLNILLVPQFGLVGAAISLLVANTFGMTVRWWQVQRRVKVEPLDRKVLKPFVNIAATGILCFGIALWLRDTLGGDVMSVGHLLLFLSVMSLIVGSVYLLSFLVGGSEVEDKVFADIIRSRLGV
jgi:O-antigen/teichoic acid export membrane protein